MGEVQSRVRDHRRLAFFFFFQTALSSPPAPSTPPILSLSVSSAMADTSRQIKQMVNFIMQEAHEKVNEIRIKVRNNYHTCVIPFSHTLLIMFFYT